MENDYVYPSIYFAYFLFFILMVVALYFLIRSSKDGYWGKDSEAAKYRMLRDDDQPDQDDESAWRRL